MTGAGNNTWLVDGAEPLLVDAGVGRAAHVDAVARALGGRPLARVVVTHGHADHASGVPALRARWPQLEVCRLAADTAAGERAIADGDTIDAGATRLAVVHTPGHAPDHVCLWSPDARVLFTGDMLVAGSTVMIPAGRGGRLADYLASLERLRGLTPTRAYPGHGPIIDAPIALIDDYLAHRRERDAQVRACLVSGVTDVDEMVERIYPGLAGALRPAARATVEAHLELIRERAASRR